MKYLAAIFLLVLTMLGAAAEPFCTVTTFDEESGLSQRLVKGIVQDRDGYIWIGTWNGLNRFDGREMATIRPGSDDEAFRYSNRIGDLRLSPGGNLLCRIDDRVSLFDVRTFEFRDLHAELEAELGTRLEIRQIIPTLDKEIVFSTKGGRYIVLPAEETAEGAYFADEQPRYKYAPRTCRLRSKIEGFNSDEIVVSRIDDDGTIWIITRDGMIFSGPGTHGPFKLMEKIDVTPGSLAYCMTDNNGDVWLRSSEGAHKVSMGRLPYSAISTHADSRVRVTMLDPAGKIWLAESDADAVSIMNPATGEKKYLTADGKLSDGFAVFGASIYSIARSGDGTVWLGSKPSGSFRLTPDDTGNYRVEHFDTGNTYDYLFDRNGALWIATMGGGLLYCPDPKSGSPEFIPMNTVKGYPADARLVRHLTVAGDSMLLAATTSGLLALDIARPIPGDSLRASLIVSRPGQQTSLGNIAVMDVAVAPDGKILVATESDGLNVASPAPVSSPEEWAFTHHNASGGLADVALSVSPIPDSEGRFSVTSDNNLYLYNPSSGSKIAFGQWFWRHKLRLTDARPVILPDGAVILGHENGAVMIHLDSVVARLSEPAPVHFTAVSIQGHPERLLPALTDTIVLDKDERNMTIKFALLEFVRSSDAEYTVTFGNNPPVKLGNQNSLTLLDLDPGEYTLTVTASSPAGNVIENSTSLTVIVTPTFWETGTAKVLYVILVLTLVSAVAWIVVYIRAMKRKQREILNAYLAIVNTSPAESSAGIDTENMRNESEVEKLSLSPDDKEMMDAVTAFVTDHIADTEVTVDDLAQAVSLSRSSLNRKMKSIMGVTPAEFIRESRLSKAAQLLSDTGMSIKEIAYDCGFADINYFGKCFKASRGVTPGAYRKSDVK